MHGPTTLQATVAIDPQNELATTASDSDFHQEVNEGAPKVVHNHNNDFDDLGTLSDYEFGKNCNNGHVA